MQSGLTEIDNSAAARVFDVSIMDVPLLGSRPVKYSRAGRDFVNSQRNSLPNTIERRADPITSNAAANRVELRGECMELSSEVRSVPEVERLRQIPVLIQRQHS